MPNSIPLHPTKNISDINLEIEKSHRFLLHVVSLFWSPLEIIVRIFAVPWPLAQVPVSDPWYVLIQQDGDSLSV